MACEALAGVSDCSALPAVARRSTLGWKSSSCHHPVLIFAFESLQVTTVLLGPHCSLPGGPLPPLRGHTVSSPTIEIALPHLFLMVFRPVPCVSVCRNNAKTHYCDSSFHLPASCSYHTVCGRGDTNRAPGPLGAVL